jgi:hypothetical protein
MKILVENETNLCKFIWDNGYTVTQTDTSTTTDEQNILDMTIDNSTIYDDVTPPEDFAVNKYFYDGQNFTLNEEYIDPETLFIMANTPPENME